MALTLVTSDLIHGLDYSKLTGTIPTWNQDTTGNADTATLAAGATILATARNIGGVSFNGSAAIDLPGVNTAGNQNTSGVAATATLLATARTIGGVSFNGSTSINLPGVNTAGNQDTSGNAGSVTNGVYTVGNQTIGGTKTFSSAATFQLSALTNPSGVDANTVLTIKNNGWSGITMLSSAAAGSFLTFGDADAGFRGRIQYLQGSTDAMVFETAASEKMRITSGGDVKIGDSTTDVTSKLTVSGNGSVNTATFMYDGNAGTYFDIDTEAANGSVILSADARSGNYPPMLFKTGGSTRLTISSGSSPLVTTGDLKVAGSYMSNGNATLYINGAAAADPSWIYWQQGSNLRWLSGLEGSSTDFWFLSYGSSGNGMPRLILKENGNVGIGTASLSSKFTVVGGTSTFVYDNSPQGTASSVYRDAVFGSTQTVNTGITIFGTGQTGISFGDADSNIRGQVRYQHSSNTLELGAAGNIDMFISSAKGIASPSRSFHSGHDGSTGSSGAGTATVGCTLGSGGFLTAHRANATCLYIGTTTDREVMAIFKGTSQAGKIRISGASTVAFESGSDYRLKEDLKDFNGLDIISKLKVYNFNWIGEDRRDHGLIAHEVQEVLPDLVSGKKDGVLDNGKIDKQTLDYGRFTPMLIKAMQEQQAQIELLKQEVELLKQ